MKQYWNDYGYKIGPRRPARGCLGLRFSLQCGPTWRVVMLLCGAYAAAVAVATAAAMATVGLASPVPPLVAVPSFAILTSAETTRRFFGPGLPSAFDTHVPPIPALVERYLAEGQTLAFLDVSELEGSGAATTLAQHKVVVLPETAGLSDAAGAELLAFARSGGAVVVVGGALARGANGAATPNGFATPLGQALGLRRRAAGPLAGAATIASRNISQSANPEWWRLLSPLTHGGAASGSTATQLDGPVGAGLTLHTVKPTKGGTEGDGSALVLATATLAGGTTTPLLTATRAGQRGWLVYCATSADAQLVQQAVRFVISATGVADPYAPGPYSPMSVKVTGVPTAAGAGTGAGGPGAAGGSSLPSTAILSYSAPADPQHSLEGRFRVTLVGAAATTPNATICVTFLDRWWGDSPPSQHITNTSSPRDFAAITAQKTYTGTVACATISPNRTMGQGQPWFELRTAANGMLHGFCKTPPTKLAAECELNGRCSSTSAGAGSGGGGDCVCLSGWIGPTCGTLDLLPGPRRGAWPHHRPNASAPIAPSGLRAYEVRARKAIASFSSSAVSL